MALNVGELQATLGINTKNFTQGIADAESKIDGLTDTLSIEVQKSSEEASAAIDGTTQSLEDLKRTAKDTGKESEEAGKKVKKAGDDVETTGKKAKTAEDYVKKFKEALGMIGVTVGIGTLISKITEVIAGLKEAYDLSEKAAASFERTLGTDNVNVELYKDYIKSIMPYTTLSEQDIANTVSAVIKAQPEGTDPEYIKSLTKDYLALGEMGFGSLTNNIRLATDVFTKWGVSTEDQSRYLSLFLDICRNSDVDMTTLLQTLTEIDSISGKLGFSLDEAASAIGNAGMTYANEWATLANKGELLYTQMWDSIAKAHPEYNTEQIKKDVDDLFNKTLQQVKDLPEEKRASIWAALFGEPTVSMTTLNFAKGINMLAGTGNKTYAPGESVNAQFVLTWTTEDREAVANAITQYSNKEESKIFSWLDTNLGSRYDEIIDAARVGYDIQDVLVYGFDRVAQSTELIADKPQVVIDNKVYVTGISDPYKVSTDTQQTASAAALNPNYY